MDNGTDSTVTEYIGGLPYVELPKYRTAEPVGDVEIDLHDGINFELLDEILSFIKAHPLTWQQDSWYRTMDLKTGDIRYFSQEEIVEDVNSCGTAFCFAGHVAIHEGFPAPPLNGDAWYRQVKSTNSSWGTYTEEVNEFAQKRLGLSYNQADALFSGHNSLDDLKNMVTLLHYDPSIDGDEMEEVTWYAKDQDLSILEAHRKYYAPDREDSFGER